MAKDHHLLTINSSKIKHIERGGKIEKDTMSEFYDMKTFSPQMKNHRIGTIMLENDNKIAKKNQKTD